MCRLIQWFSKWGLRTPGVLEKVKGGLQLFLEILPLCSRIYIFFFLQLFSRNYMNFFSEILKRFPINFYKIFPKTQFKCTLTKKVMLFSLITNICVFLVFVLKC